MSYEMTVLFLSTKNKIIAIEGDPDEPNLHNHVVDGETGVIASSTTAGVREGVNRVLAGGCASTAIRDAAEEWSAERFHDRIRAVVGEHAPGVSADALARH